MLGVDEALSHYTDRAFDMLKSSTSTWSTTLGADWLRPVGYLPESLPQSSERRVDRSGLLRSDHGSTEI
jgi:hypothetical protein